MNAPPEKNVGAGAISLDDKVVVKLNRPPLDEEAFEIEEPVVATSTPTATIAPVATTTPTATSTPVATSTPTATSTPVAPTTPTDTSTPVTTTTPTATSTPVATSTPEATEEEEVSEVELALPFRTVVAQVIHLRPSKSTRKHVRAKTQCTSEGNLETLDGSANGTTTATSTTNGASNGTSTATVVEPEEEVCILLARKEKRNSTSTDFVIKGRKPSKDIDRRLARINRKLESEGKTDRLARAEARTQEREEKKEERAQAAEERGKKDDVKKAETRGKKGDEDGKGGGKKPDDRGGGKKPDDKGGGKKPDDKGGGKKPDDKGGGKK